MKQRNHSGCSWTCYAKPTHQRRALIALSKLTSRLPSTGSRTEKQRHASYLIPFSHTVRHLSTRHTTYCMRSPEMRWKTRTMSGFGRAIVTCCVGLAVSGKQEYKKMQLCKLFYCCQYGIGTEAIWLAIGRLYRIWALMSSGLGLPFTAFCGMIMRFMNITHYSSTRTSHL